MEHKESNFSIQNLLIEAGNNKKVARRVPFINKKNRKQRLYFGIEFILRNSTFCNNMIFCDISQDIEKEK